MEILEYFASIWKPLAEIIALWYLFYLVLLFIKGTRAFQVLKGLAIIFVSMSILAFFITQKMELHILNWIIERLFGIVVIALIILFQPELRQGLAKIGQRGMFSLPVLEQYIIQEIVDVAYLLSKKRTGAIMAIERDASLRIYIESGIGVDGQVTNELINTIFTPNSTLHDGGLVIRADRILAAGCLFPLTDNPHISKRLGTRHRAAIGLTEETDAVVVVVSEETGAMSIAVDGKLMQGLDKDGLEKMLINLCSIKQGRAKKNIIKLLGRKAAK
ncbi:MAG: diadenylate cyclase CdaA [Candidatus Omnitrophica bacterium]|nr:diadenylate cyclase CdaA [Candidatus Omnitrophota bacterium]